MKPYAELEPAFIRNTIRGGSFVDVTYRQYVNTLVWIEHITTADRLSHVNGIVRLGISILYYQCAAKYPAAFDRIRRGREELSSFTRASLGPAVGRHATDQERDSYTREYAEQWRRIQEADDDVNAESLHYARSVQRDDV